MTKSTCKNESGIALVMVLLTMVVALGAVAAVYVAFNTQGNLAQTMPNTEIAMNKAEAALEWAKYSLAQGDTESAIDGFSYTTPDNWQITISATSTTLTATATQGRYSRSVAWDYTVSLTPGVGFSGVDHSVLCDSDINVSGTGSMNMNAYSTDTPTSFHSNGNINGINVQNIGNASFTAQGTVSATYPEGKGASSTSGADEVPFPMIDIKTIAASATSGNVIDASSGKLDDNSIRPVGAKDANGQSVGTVITIDVGSAEKLTLNQNYVDAVFAGTNNIVVFVGDSPNFTVEFTGGNINAAHILSEGALNFSQNTHVNNGDGVIYTTSEADPAVNLANPTNVSIGSLVSKGKVLLNAGINYDGTIKYKTAWEDLLETYGDVVLPTENPAGGNTTTFDNWHEVASAK